MKNKPKAIFSTDIIVITLGVIITIYFLYTFISLVWQFINMKIDVVDNISAITSFFK